MEVLSLGFSRTGTLSMREALTILGYPTYHFVSIFENCRDADMWLEALNAKFKGHGQIDWKQHFDQLLGHVSAITDTPSVMFWKELCDAYPDAKVVLVERDEDKWLRSCETLFEGVLNPIGQNVLRFTDPFWFGRIITCGATWIEAFTGSKNLALAKKNARVAYRKHYADIRAYVPKERILEYKLGSGWEPLCEFLGKKVPDGVPFPNRNEAATLQKSFGAKMQKAFKNSLFNVSVVVVGVVGVFGVARLYV